MLLNKTKYQNQRPITKDQVPKTKDQEPKPKAQFPKTKVQFPKTKTQNQRPKPKTKTKGQSPITKDQRPKPKDLLPKTNIQIPQSPKINYHAFSLLTQFLLQPKKSVAKTGIKTKLMEELPSTHFLYNKLTSPPITAPKIAQLT